MSSFVKQIYRNLPKHNAIIFLDRDGTINKEVDYLQRVDQIAILPHVAEGIKLLNQKQIAAVVITNQPVVGRGLISIAELEHINNTIEMLLRKRGAFINAIYSCPHHPNATVKSFHKKCRCRKPNTLLYKHAVKDFKPKKVLGMIGDSTRDIQFGKNLGIPTAIVPTGYMGNDGVHDVTPDFIGKNFLDCVTRLLKNL